MSLVFGHFSSSQSVRLFLVNHQDQLGVGGWWVSSREGVCAKDKPPLCAINTIQLSLAYHVHSAASQLGINVDKGDGNCVKEHLQLDKVYNGNGGCQREREFNHNDSDGGRL